MTVSDSLPDPHASASTDADVAAEAKRPAATTKAGTQAAPGAAKKPATSKKQAASKTAAGNSTSSAAKSSATKSAAAKAPGSKAPGAKSPGSKTAAKTTAAKAVTAKVSASKSATPTKDTPEESQPRLEAANARADVVAEQPVAPPLPTVSASEAAAQFEEAPTDSPVAVAVQEIAIDSATPAVVLRDITKRFGQNVAVDSVTISIPAGSFYGIVGPNGAGKTTTLSMIAGLLRPDAGTIEIAGIDLAREPRKAKRQLGILPDRLRTFDRLTGRQLLYYYGTLRGLGATVVESRIADLARAFDLADALGRTVADFSTGMTKKVMLAGAMIHSPRVLVLDEPFESVDPVSSAVILDILRAYVDHGGTVVLSSHGMELVERVCGSVAIIVGGRVLAEGSLDAVRGGKTLEERFIELSGGLSDVEGLEWLHSFSD